MNVGIILPHIGPAQLTEEILSAVDNSKNNISLFYENPIDMYRQVPVPKFNISETVFFSGRLIGTTLFSVQYMISSLQDIEPIVYLYDLPWLRGYTDYISNLNLLRNKDLRIITRCNDYARLAKNYLNREVEVLTIGELII